MKYGKKFYVVDGKELPLYPVDSARFVSLAKGQNLGHIAGRLARSSRVAIDSSVPANMLVVHGDVNKLAEIREKPYPEVYCTRAVYLNKTGLRMILTNDVLVKFKDEIDSEARQKLIEKLKCRIVEAGSSVWRIRVWDPHDEAPLAVANELSQHPQVIFAEPDFIQRAVCAQAPPPPVRFFANQWHLHNTGQKGGKAGADVKALDAWGIIKCKGAANIRVVLLDCGVDLGHPDLKSNLAAGLDIENDDPDPSNTDDGHGTACAGIIAATQTGGVVGIAPECKVAPFRIFSGSSPCVHVQTSVLTKAFEKAVEYGEIISCSWGTCPTSAVTDAIRRAAREGRGGLGIPVFCATGNSGDDELDFPASLDETIGVGASTNLDVLWEYSNYGEGLDFLAPSSGGTLGIETTDVTGPQGYNTVTGEGGCYCKADNPTGFGGTSAAAPLAAGVAALILSVNDRLTAEQVRQIMRDTADKIDPHNAGYVNNRSEKYGYGRINAARAVRAAQELRERA